MARRDSMADVMQALGILAETAAHIHAVDVGARMDALRIETEQRGRLKEVELQGTINEYYDLKKERAEVAAILQKEYPRLDDKHISDNFSSIANTFEGVAENDMSNLESNMDLLIDDISNLKGLEQQLAGQKSYYKGQEQAIAGLTTIVDPGEFEGFVEDYREEFPGAPTAGLYAGYESGIVSTYQRRKAADDMQAVSKASAQSNWTAMRELATSDDFEDLLGVATEDEALQKTFGQMISHDSYQDIVKYMNTDTTGEVKDLFYDLFPTQMWAMEGHIQSIDAIESEFLGTGKKSTVDNITSDFLLNVSKAKSNKEAFILYDQQQALLTNEVDKKAMFAAMEEQLGKGDLYEGKGGYKEHLGKGSKFDSKKPLRVSLKEPVLESYAPSDDQTTAEQVYEALDSIEAEGLVSEEGLSGEFVTAGLIERLAGGEGRVRREEWTPGKALFGGVGSFDVGFDSPYYDAFYDEVEDQFSNLMSEEDPFGPDFLYSGMAEEHQVPRLIKERYGDAVWESVYKIADEAGRRQQIKHIESTLKKGSGEDYWDLIRALDAIKE